MTLGQKIREMRKKMGISQEVLGEIVNIYILIQKILYTIVKY